MYILNNIEFLDKWAFLLLIFIPVLSYLFYKKQSSGIIFSQTKDLKQVFKMSASFYLKQLFLVLILLAFIFILANPNIKNVSQKIKKNGIDIVLVLDVSGSMDAQDLKPSRIEAAKKVIGQFVQKLKTDRLGLVVFAGKPFTSIPLTFDYNIVGETISRLSTDTINQQNRTLGGTAIGDAILMAKTLFKTSKSSKQEEKEREKVIILLTDGDANVGVDPLLAGLSAKQEGIKIYTIGIGSKKGGYITYYNGPFKQTQKIPPLNDKILKKIAGETGGVYFRAEDNNSFEEIFRELSKLEKNDINIEVKKQFKEYYTLPVYLLLFLITAFSYFIFLSVETRFRK